MPTSDLSASAPGARYSKIKAARAEAAGRPWILSLPRKSRLFATRCGRSCASSSRPTIRDKVLAGRELGREDYLEWQRRLHERGWGGVNWPTQFGGTGWNAVQQFIFEEESAAGGAPRLIPFGLKMVAPVLMAFGNPGAAATVPAAHPVGRDLVVPGVFRAGRRFGSRLAAHPRSARGRSLRRERPEDLEYAGPVRRLDVLPGAHRPRRPSSNPASRSC